MCRMRISRTSKENTVDIEVEILDYLKQNKGVDRSSAQEELFIAQLKEKISRLRVDRFFVERTDGIVIEVEAAKNPITLL